MLIIRLIQILFLSLTTTKQEPKYSLKKREETNYRVWFVILTIVLVLFFAVIFISAIAGMSYVESGTYYNHLQNGGV